ncbi:hypothetical protein AGDE_03564 [Angomonas deanei]|uniref:Uncharacterized protein n=1 Tax=Angomonas deanei TaxID=59799 RepID=S9VHM7_9TRYP|nr:hypothetical protein AGDE_11223 [Angomonas deanei]EPY34370.1 hypothetical protein AGDE_07950 [Angomonas deanei]EPY38437.1 hypothetical protein AGDE_05492 [Angomonas deanei]EPY40364.1 hypothetical protein AGDE_03564 [Angomonas deanei]CAD2221619.1 hypothetical protein, conserved [Angomonas deanei]|eukprot:EPY26538.1 hypothetical protein AGDE_11223 [Angomonas deanei]
MLRRCALATVGVSGLAGRHYRIIPHVYNEIEELAETQKMGRWNISHRNCMQQALKKGEIMADKLNYREKRRTGILPEKSIARRLSQTYGVDGEVVEPASKTKWINITVLGFDGHPFHFRIYPMPDVTLNTLIDGSGMCHGHSGLWGKCNNPDCADWNHGYGCMVNVDIETLDRLLPPNRWEYTSLCSWRSQNRGDITYNTRFSCQIPITEELDGGMFALKQYWSRSLRESVVSWGDVDNQATIAANRSKKIEPWAPIIEEPLKLGTPITIDMLWATSYQDIIQAKNSNYKRKDGYHTKPQNWAAYI